MIPKKIHYCWFGGDEIRPEVKLQIEQWKSKLPDYEIVKWDESKMSIDSSPLYVQQAYKHKKRAFVTDYARLYALYHEGGIYLDTDVDIVKDFDPLLQREMFIGFESIGYLCMGIIGAQKGNLIIKQMLEHYDELTFENGGKLNLTPNSKIMFDFLEDKFKIKYKTDEIQKFDSFTLYPRVYFSPKNYYTGKIKVTNNTFSIHKFEGSWKKKSIKDKIVSIMVLIVGERIYSRIVKFIKKK